MKRVITVLLTTILLFNLKLGMAQSVNNKEVLIIIDSCISIMKEHAVNSKKVNWDEIRVNALNSAKDANSPYELGTTFRMLYKSIDDFHGAFFYKDSIFKWNKNNVAISDSITNELGKGVTIKTEFLNHNIGYLRIPSMPIFEEQDFNRKAQNLNDSLCTLLSKNVKGIVIDLRLNGGGAMHPMILGVENLLLKGKVGSFITKKNEDWFVQDHKFMVGSTITSSITPKCDINAQNIPIVFLISPITGSSAEFLLMAFKGRKNTILLGSNTAGFVTINNGFSISESSGMNLSVGYGADRQGKIYTKAIKPDVPFVGIDKFNDIKSDEKVIAAIKWLKKRQ